MIERIVVDTSVLTAALIGETGPSRELLRRCLLAQYQPLMGNALFAEYEDVTARDEIRSQCPLEAGDIRALLDAFYSACEWVPVYYLWRPNLPDEADNHVLELAVAGHAEWIVTHNVKDFERSELRFPGLRPLPPDHMLRGDPDGDSDD